MTLLILSACGAPALTNPWEDRFLACRLLLEREQPSKGRTCAAHLAQTAPDLERSCAARLVQAEATKLIGRDPLPLIERVIEYCEDPLNASRARWLQANELLQAGRRKEAVAVLRLLALRYPETSWARRAIEQLYQDWQRQPAHIIEERLRDLLTPPNKGMLLYLAASAHAAGARGRGRGIALCLTQRRATPHSPYRDDCEDLVLRALVTREDRISWLEEILTPLPGDPYELLRSTRWQGLQYRLAEQYLLAGRYPEARWRLGRVLEDYHSIRWKDDALWLLARLEGLEGDQRARRRTLEALIRSFPHSRHLENAKAALEKD